MTTTTYQVQGMTCDHCAASVREELTELQGVTKVDVDLSSGNVDVHSDAELERDRVASAVKEAGYQLVS